MSLSGEHTFSAKKLNPPLEINVAHILH